MHHLRKGIQRRPGSSADCKILLLQLSGQVAVEILEWGEQPQISGRAASSKTVSYTHLDVYKRQEGIAFGY